MTSFESWLARAEPIHQEPCRFAGKPDTEMTEAELRICLRFMVDQQQALAGARRDFYRRRVA